MGPYSEVQMEGMSLDNVVNRERGHVNATGFVQYKRSSIHIIFS